MAKPAITFRNTKGSPLTYTELDTNFDNLQDATISFTGDAGDTRSMDLNDVTAITGSKNIKVTVSESGQSIVVKNTLSDFTLDPMGFENWTDSSIAFNTGSRVFTITPTASTFRYWYQGTQYDVTSTKSVTITNTSDLYLIYFSGDTLSITTSDIDWSTMVPVAHVYWNTTSNQGIVTDERHGVFMSRGTKEYLHAVVGAGYASGLTISNYTTTGTGALDSEAQFDLSSGVIYDQEHKIAITHSNSPTANTFEQDLQGPARIPVIHRSNNHWFKESERDYAVKNGTSLVTYNLNSAGTWSTPDATSTYYVAYWIIASNVVGSPVLSIMGQRQDNKLSDAATNNTWTSLDLTDFPADEIRPLYRVIFRTATGYANTPKAFIAQVDDFRFSEIVPAGGAATGDFVTVDTVQTITGSKTFTATTTLGPYVESVYDIGSSGSGTVTPNFNNGPVQKLQADGNFTLALPTNMTAGSNLTLVITQDGTGGRLMTPNAAYRFAGGAKTLSTGSQAIDVMTIFYDGSRYLASLIRNYVL